MSPAEVTWDLHKVIGRDQKDGIHSSFFFAQTAKALRTVALNYSIASRLCIS